MLPVVHLVVKVEMVRQLTHNQAVLYSFVVVYLFVLVETGGTVDWMWGPGHPEDLLVADFWTNTYSSHQGWVGKLSRKVREAIWSMDGESTGAIMTTGIQV